MQKDFITVTPDSGAGDKIVTVAAEPNRFTSERSSSINISAGGGMTRTVKVIQTLGGTIVGFESEAFSPNNQISIIRVRASEPVDTDVEILVHFVSTDRTIDQTFTLSMDVGEDVATYTISGRHSGPTYITSISPEKSPTQIYSY